LLVEQSLREYVAGMMLIEMLRRGGAAEPAHAGYGATMQGPAGEVVYDLSVGYDLAGIKSDKVQGFLDGMRDASAQIEILRGEIPAEFKAARELAYNPRISSSLTLSTFHGCPAGEIERICEFLIAERGLDVVVKMNPPMLGRERLEHLLHDVMGYNEITVNPAAYTSGLQFDEALDICKRLTTFAATRGRRVGFKFSNTLEVVNHRPFFTPENQLMYLSGPPLHVITMTLAEAFRQAVGPAVPITFSAGVDHANVAATVACGFCPVTVSSDLLKPGGYGRFAIYLKNLGDAMRKVGANTISDYILNACGQAENASRGVAQDGARWFEDEGANQSTEQLVSYAGWLNTPLAAAAAREEPRYRAAANRKEPKRVDSHLVIYDCLTCNKCIPVCPNAANFTYPTPTVEFSYHDVVLGADGTAGQGEEHAFKIAKDWQIANFGDFCNECGNCDTFCPEYGGPYVEKPTVYSSRAELAAAAPRDGFYLDFASLGATPQARLVGRIKGQEFSLTRSPGQLLFRDGAVEAVFDENHKLLRCTTAAPGAPHTLKMEVYYTFYFLLTGLLDARHLNPVNITWVTAGAACTAAHSGAVAN
jgi:putative selenate reductase